ASLAGRLRLSDASRSAACSHASRSAACSHASRSAVCFHTPRCGSRSVSPRGRAARTHAHAPHGHRPTFRVEARGLRTPHSAREPVAARAGRKASLFGLGLVPRCGARTKRRLTAMSTHPRTGTRIDEIEAGIYRISTPVTGATPAEAFSFNQYLLVD